MDKWLIPTVILVLVICVLYPIFLVILGLTGLLFYLILFYFNHALPPPYLSVTSELNIKINWFSRLHQNTKLVITLTNGTTIDYEPDEKISNEYTENYTINSKVIPNLDPSNPEAKIQYRIVEIKPNSIRTLFGGKKYWFKVPQQQLPKMGLKIAVLGDMQPKPTIPPLFQLYMMKKVAKTNPDLFFYLGDHTNEGTFAAGWRQFYILIGMIATHTPVFGVPGNHDLELKRKGGKRLIEAVYRTYVNYPDPKIRYFLKIYGINLFAFDFFSSFDETSENYALLEKNLNNISREDRTIVLWHSSPYNSLRIDDQIESIRKNFIPRLENKGNRLWLGGHEHSYQKYRVRNSYYITTAATSSFHRHHESLEHMEKLILKFHFVLLTLTESQLNLKAIAFDNQILDDFNISQ